MQINYGVLVCRHGPAYGLHTQQATGDPLLEVLSRVKRRCVMIDRSDCLNRHLTGMPGFQDLQLISPPYRIHTRPFCSCWQPFYGSRDWYEGLLQFGKTL